jgi:type IV secretory pathway VirB10-like protein
MCVRAERVAILAIVALVGAASFGCTHAQAKVNPELPGLDVPAPPPRNVEATEELPPLPATTTEETPGPIAPARPRPPAAQQRPEPARPEPARVEPPTTLQTAPADREAQVERNIRDRLARASAGLNRVDYRGLNGDARTQYDQAMRFISQARDALRDRNLVFANNLAEKALTLAAQLAGR